MSSRSKFTVWNAQKTEPPSICKWNLGSWANLKRPFYRENMTQFSWLIFAFKTRRLDSSSVKIIVILRVEKDLQLYKTIKGWLALVHSSFFYVVVTRKELKVNISNKLKKVKSVHLTWHFLSKQVFVHKMHGFEKWLESMYLGKSTLATPFYAALQCKNIVHCFQDDLLF